MVKDIENKIELLFFLRLFAFLCYLDVKNTKDRWATEAMFAETYVYPPLCFGIKFSLCSRWWRGKKSLINSNSSPGTHCTSSGVELSESELINAYFAFHSFPL